MDRLTITKKLPPKGTFVEFSREDIAEMSEKKDIGEDRIYRRLQEYENTGLSPTDIEALKVDCKKLHNLLKSIEEIIKVKEAQIDEISVENSCMKNTHIDMLDLSTRTRNCLLRANYETVGDVLALSETQLLHIRNLGKKCAEEIITKIHDKGLKMSWEEVKQ